ncbi:hypothetical protein, partial [Staphylococcus aureus]|uniref:hypothetical protein n=1 Tax=Staphylococcus aureus TaxID=1280 RepID=UPI0020BEC24B
KDATKAAPINKGDLLLHDATAGAYGMKKAVDGDVFDAVSKQGLIEGPEEPCAVHLVAGNSRINKMKYTGTAPTLGQSVVASGVGTVKATATANKTRVVAVDTALQIVEVLI